MRKLILPAIIFIFSLPALRAEESSPLSLSIKDAISLAIKNNLTIKLSKAATRQSRSMILQSASALLPQVMGTMSENRTYKLNLAALGFQPGLAPGFPNALGPFNVFDARLHLVDNILNLSATQSLRAAHAQNKMALFGENLAAEQVAAAASLAYIENLRAQKEILSSEADEELAVELLKLAADKVNAGTADPIDLARAKTSRSEAHLRVITANLSAQKADMNLKHIIGVPLGRSLVLSDSLKAVLGRSLGLNQSLKTAFSKRLEIKIEKESVEGAELTLSAAHLARVPVVSISGDYGLSGITPTKDDIQTGNLGAGLSWRFFTGGQIRSQAEEALSQIEKAKAQLEDTRVQVEQDVRTSILELNAAEEEIQTSSQTLALAGLELGLAESRFKAGVGDNQELVRAQDEMANARNSVVVALASDNDSWVNLFLALGRAENFDFKKILGSEHGNN